MQNLAINDLENINQLFIQGLYFEALDSIEKFEQREDLSLENQVSCYLLNINLYNELGKFTDALKFADDACNISKTLKNQSYLLDSYISKAMALLALRDNDLVLEIIAKGEEMLKKLEIKPKSEFAKRNALLYIIKSQFSVFQNGDIDKALEYNEQSLKISEEHDNKYEIALALKFNSIYYLSVGNFDFALDSLQRCLKIQRIFRKYDDWMTLNNLGALYGMRGELDLALDYTKQSLTLAEDIGNKTFIAQCLNNFSLIYQQKGDLKHATKALERNLKIWEEIGKEMNIIGGLDSLFIISLDANSLEQAQQYLIRMQQINKQVQDKRSSVACRVNKALMLKMSSNSLDREEAKKILQYIVKDQVIYWEFTERALLHLCDIYLFELQTYNNQEVLSEINVLTNKLLEFAKFQKSYRLLAETNLLLGKLSLIQMNLGEARQLFTIAERIADEHGLHLLARTISNEHDKLLEQLDKWENLKKSNAPVSERLKFVEIDDTLNQMMGKQMMEPPDLVEENPILLLIMSDAGDTYFKHNFIEDWDYSTLFSSFISAFNTFSSEIFAKTIDRVKIGKNIIFIKLVQPFLVCYVSKGQSYPAIKKLNKFSDSIKKKSEIWGKLNKAVESSQEYDINNFPSIGNLLKEIFIH
jgi:tetratricopeptide (TPR) repeat protein